MAKGASDYDISIEMDENKTEINIPGSQSEKEKEEQGEHGEQGKHGEQEESTREILIETIITAKAIGSLKWV